MSVHRPSTPPAPVPSPRPGGRWFLACWPDAATRHAMQRVQATRAWPPAARPTAPARLHLTLHFIGDLPGDALPALRRALDRVDAAARVPWTLDRVECWPSGIAALVPSHVPEGAAALHASLAAALRAQRLPVESRPWRPHVTLARRAGGAPSSGDVPAGPVRWTTTGFELVRSDRGYHREGRWPAARLDP